MLNCINNSAILRSSLEFVSIDDYDDIVNNEFITMCTRFGLNDTQMISLVTTLDTSLLNNHYTTIWDGLNYYSMVCMDDYKMAYIESLYKTDLMDPRIELLCDDLQEYIKCNTCINVENNKCSTFKDACNMHHDVCVKYLLNNPQNHDAENDKYCDYGHYKIYKYYRNYRNTNIIDYICACGGSLDVIKYAFENQKKDCTTSAIDCASERGHLDVIKYLFEIQNKNCTTNAIDWASMNGHLDVVTYLFEIQKKNCTTNAIDWASYNGHLSILKYLFEIQNKNHTTGAIDWAHSNNQFEVVKYLFEMRMTIIDHQIDHIKFGE